MCMADNASLWTSEIIRVVKDTKQAQISEWIQRAASQVVKAGETTARSVNYYLIDWGEAETIASDQSQGRAVTLQCSYPLRLTAVIDVLKRRDQYALDCSLIVLYTESAKLGEDWMWTVKFELNEDRCFLVKKCLSKRKDVLSKIAVDGEANPFPKFIRSLAKNCNAIWKMDRERIAVDDATYSTC